MKMIFIISFTTLLFKELFEINRENERVMVEIYRGQVINIISFLFLLTLVFTPDLGYGQEPMSFKSFVAIENKHWYYYENHKWILDPEGNKIKIYLKPSFIHIRRQY